VRFPVPLTPIDFRSELFASTFSFGVTALLRLISSLIVTRLLTPEAYGIFAIVLSILFIIELISDVGTVGLLIRHPRGDEKRFIHTIWTVRLLRNVGNFALLFLCAPLIAAFYREPVLSSALRLLSFWFLLFGAESMSFVLAQRDRRARISNYCELAANAVMTVFVIAMATVVRNHFALISGVLLQRALLAAASYFFYRNIGVGFAFDREALTDQFRFARIVLPSSILTMVLSQYDKLVLLKLFNLTLLGIYGIASNIVAPITGVIMHNARTVLYARCAEYFRSNPATARDRYYSENQRLLLVGSSIPAVVAGFSQFMVKLLYDPRFAAAGTMLLILGLGAVISAFQNASENLLVASGRTHVVLIANCIRLASVVPATFIGFYLFGFYGFLWFNFLATIPLLVYFFAQQRKQQLLDLGYELRHLCIAFLIFVVCFALSQLLLRLFPDVSLSLWLRGRHALSHGG
jgi:lipopolysaccharide exporter